MVDGSPTASNERWGRFLNDEQSVPLNDMSGEMYGGQDVDVEWRRGSLRLAGYANAKQQARLLVDRIRGARSGPWTTPKNGDALYEPINFGVVRTYQGRGGGGAIYLGLAKDRQPNRIRPTFLEQTDVRAATHTAATRTHTFSSPFASLLVHAHLPLRPRLLSCCTDPIDGVRLCPAHPHSRTPPSPRPRHRCHPLNRFTTSWRARRDVCPQSEAVGRKWAGDAIKGACGGGRRYGDDGSGHLGLAV